MTERAPVFGEWFTGVYASDDNPKKHGRYVRTVHRRGRMNPGTFYELTDGNGLFWQYPVVGVVRRFENDRVRAIQELGAMARGEDPDEDGWRDYDHGFRDGYQAALRERRAEIEALLPKVYDGTHLTDCPYVDVLMRIREVVAFRGPLLDTGGDS